MNTQSEAISTAEAQTTAAAVIPESRRIYWTIRREFWENRSLYLVPVTVAVLFIAGFFISVLHPSVHMHTRMSLDPVQQQEQPYNIASLFIMGVTLLVAMFYCVDALYSERRDRSILFWKSMPVSDLTTVLAKAAIPVLVMPLLMFAVTLATQAIMLLISSTVMLARGQSVAALWTHLRFFQMSLGLLFHLLAIHGFWYAPIYCWLLLVSAFARRAPFLWVVLPPLAIVVVEKIAFDTSHFGAFVAHRFFGGPAEDAPFVGDNMTMNGLTLADVGRFLADPGLWTGLVAAAAFLALAVWLRRSREPM
jgi:ABC-2 type transport system permease protein